MTGAEAARRMPKEMLDRLEVPVRAEAAARHVQESGTGVLHEVPAVGDLKRLRVNPGHRLAVAATTITRDALKPGYDSGAGARHGCAWHLRCARAQVGRVPERDHAADPVPAPARSGVGIKLKQEPGRWLRGLLVRPASEGLFPAGSCRMAATAPSLSSDDGSNLWRSLPACGFPKLVRRLHYRTSSFKV